jgi:hypothetical protein
MATKHHLITLIHIGRSNAGMSSEDAMASISGYRRKSLAELRQIIKDDRAEREAKADAVKELPTLHTTHKVNVNRGKRRIPLDNKRLSDYGFAGGQRYYLTKRTFHAKQNNEIVISYSDASTFDEEDLSIGQEIRVMGYAISSLYGQANIYLTGAIVNEVFPGATHVNVSWNAQRLVITPA